MRGITREAVHALFLVNVGLQVCDGVATYHGLQLGLPEGNPLMRASIAHWGVGGALLVWKTTACLLLLFLRAAGPHPVIARALTLTAACYIALSLLPWLSVLLPCWWE